MIAGMPYTNDNFKDAMSFSSAQRASIAREIFFTAAIAAIGLAIYVQWGASDAGDKRWLLLAARMVLSGKHLYDDIFETNLPLIVWLYTVPAFLASHIREVADTQILTLLVLCLVVCSAAVSVRLMARHPEFAGNAKKRGAFALLLCFVYLLWAPPTLFGDREHLFLLLAFPYILRCSPSLAGAALPISLRLAVACMGAVGFCIKPHCVVVFLGMQALVIWRERSPRILLSMENLIICGAGAVYLLLVYLFAPTFFYAVLPMEIATYGYYSWGWSVNARNFFPALAVISIVMTAFHRCDVSPYRADALYFLGICASFVLYILANNGWGYTFYPLDSMVLFTVAWLWWEFRWLKRDASARGVVPVSRIQGEHVCALVLVAVSALVMFFYDAVLTGEMTAPVETKVIAEFARTIREHHARSFGCLIPTFNACSEPARKTDARLETRFHHLWMMPAFAAEGKEFAAKYARIPTYVATKLAEDMEYNKPDLMFVDTSPEFFVVHKPFDLVAYFSTTLAFKEAWRHYRYIKEINYCEPSRAGKKTGTGCSFAIYARAF